MPAAAVIPAPIAYIKVVAVKKLVVGSVSYDVGSPLAVSTGMSCGTSCRWWSGPSDLCRVRPKHAVGSGCRFNPAAVLLTECRGGPARLL